MAIERRKYRFSVNETPRGAFCISAYLVGLTIPSLDDAITREAQQQPLGSLRPPQRNSRRRI